MSYEEVLEESVQLSKRPGDGLDEAIRYLRGKVEKATGEARGRVLCLLGQYLFDAEHKTEGAACQAEALTLVNSPAARMEVLVSAVYACIPFRRVSQGLHHVTEGESILAANPTDEAVVRWKAVLVRNAGDLLMRVGDYDTALPLFREAVALFHESGRRQESLRSKVDVAEALMHIGQLAAALALCREVRVDVASTFVLFRLSVVQGRIAARMGKVADAERLIDQAYKTLYEKMSDWDRYTARDLERAKAEVAEAKGDNAGAKALYYYARRTAAAIGVAFE